MSWQAQLMKCNEKRTLKRQRIDALIKERAFVQPFRPKKDNKWNEYTDLCAL